jgi:hypothetical protein
MTNTWKHAKAGELETTKTKLANMPSVGVVHINDKSRQLIAWEMVESAGRMQHHYTDAAYRRRGIGRCVELKLCRKLIQQDIWPAKNVVINNVAVIETTKKSKFWSVIVDEASNNNEPLTIVYREFQKSTLKT